MTVVIVTIRSLKAKKVLYLTKPVTRGRSANYIWSYEKRRRLLASYLRLETFASKASVFPKEIYGRLNFNLGAVDFDFLEFEIHGHRMESIMALILGNDEPQHWSQCHASSLSPVDLLMARLNVTQAESLETGEGFFHWTVMESIEKFWSFDGAAAKGIRGFFFLHPLLVLSFLLITSTSSRAMLPAITCGYFRLPGFGWIRYWQKRRVASSVAAGERRDPVGQFHGLSHPGSGDGPNHGHT